MDGYLNYNFNLHKLGSRGGLTLSEVPVNDGQWHSLKVRRYGSVASLSLDGGEGRRYNETVEYESLRQLIKVRENGVFVGGYLKTPDFRNSK